MPLIHRLQHCLLNQMNERTGLDTPMQESKEPEGSLQTCTEGYYSPSIPPQAVQKNFNRLGYYWKSKHLDGWRDCLKVDRSKHITSCERLSSTDKISRLEEAADWIERHTIEISTFQPKLLFAFTFTQLTTPSCIGTRVWLHSFLLENTLPPKKKKKIIILVEVVINGYFFFFTLQNFDQDSSPTWSAWWVTPKNNPQRQIWSMTYYDLFWPNWVSLASLIQRNPRADRRVRDFGFGHAPRACNIALQPYDSVTAPHVAQRYAVRGVGAVYPDIDRGYPDCATLRERVTQIGSFQRLRGVTLQPLISPPPNVFVDTCKHGCHHWLHCCTVALSNSCTFQNQPTNVHQHACSAILQQPSTPSCKLMQHLNSTNTFA